MAFCEAGQSVTVSGHAVIVAVLVLNTVEVLMDGPLPVAPVAVAVLCASATGQTVVDTTMVSVVT